MKLIERREYRFVNVDYSNPGNGILLRDWVIRPLGLTICRYSGPKWAVRRYPGRVAIDLGRVAVLFWAFAPRTA